MFEMCRPSRSAVAEAPTVEASARAQAEDAREQDDDTQALRSAELVREVALGEAPGPARGAPDDARPALLFGHGMYLRRSAGGRSYTGTSTRLRSAARAVVC